MQIAHCLWIVFQQGHIDLRCVLLASQVSSTLSANNKARTKTLEYSEVVFYDPMKQTCSLEKETFNPETSVAHKNGTKYFTQKIHWELQKSHDCSNSLNRMSNKILSDGFHCFLLS